MFISRLYNNTLAARSEQLRCELNQGSDEVRFLIQEYIFIP